MEDARDIIDFNPNKSPNNSEQATLYEILHGGIGHAPAGATEYYREEVALMFEEIEEERAAGY